MKPFFRRLQWEHSVVGKRGRILGIFIFIFSLSFKNVSYVFVKIVQRKYFYLYQKALW